LSEDQLSEPRVVQIVALTPHVDDAYRAIGHYYIAFASLISLMWQILTEEVAPESLKRAELAVLVVNDRGAPLSRRVCIVTMNEDHSVSEVAECVTLIRGNLHLAAVRERVLPIDGLDVVPSAVGGHFACLSVANGYGPVLDAHLAA
jgi:hypothetical protein